MSLYVDVRIVGCHTLPVADPTECIKCKDADYGDVLIDGVCSHVCLKDLIYFCTK